MDTFVLFQKMYDYVVWIFPLIGKFPKNQRFTLGQQIENKCLVLLEMLLRCQQTSDKEELCTEIRCLLETLFIYVRLAKDVHLLSVQHYSVSAEKLNEIKRIFAGFSRKFSHHTSYATQ